MANVASSAIVDYLTRSRETTQAAIDDPTFIAAAIAIVDRLGDSLAVGNELLLVGNGGSAGDAQHIAGEFLSRLNCHRAPAAVIALTTDTSMLTAICNDDGYATVFERQVLGLGRPGNVLIAISTSGQSPNILRALEAGRRIGLVMVGLTGGSMAPICDVCRRAPSDYISLIQQLHITAGHVICGLVEERHFPREVVPQVAADAAE